MIDTRSQILKAARDKAEKMVAQAEKEAKTRKADADTYAFQVLHTLEEQLTSVLTSVRKGLDILTAQNY